MSWTGPTLRARRRTNLNVLAAAATFAAAVSITSLAGGGDVAAAPVVTQTDITSPLANSQFFGSAVTVLSNGNYVVVDQFYSDGATSNVGAVYLYDGTTNELISTLTGSTAGDQIGSGGVVELANGHFIVVSPEWNLDETTTDVGAVTSVDSALGRNGSISIANSMHGSTKSDRVGSGGIIVLSDPTGVNEKIFLSEGSFVVSSPMWNNAEDSKDRVGAVTYVSGGLIASEAVDSRNSIVGSTDFDMVGSGGVIALPRGHFVISSPEWDTEFVIDAGAVTTAVGVARPTAGQLSGPLTTENSLHGEVTGDRIGSAGVTILETGAFVVQSPLADINGVENAGAATLLTGRDRSDTGAVTAVNSLHGTTKDDQVGLNVTALAGNAYVVGSPNWNSPFAARGGATTFSGDEATTGPVNASNSLYGTTTDDGVGTRIARLENGDYLSVHPFWDNDAMSDVGAVTVGNGVTGVVGAVNETNSSHGDDVGDMIGSGGVEPLKGGGFVVSSPYDDVNGVSDAGSVRVEPGIASPVPIGSFRQASLVGAITEGNSLHGTSPGDHVGGSASSGLTLLANGNLVVGSPEWDLGGVADVGAVTFVDTSKGISGPVNADNSLHGSSTGDGVSSGGFVPLTNGNFVVRSSSWDNGPIANVGAATFGNGTTGLIGPVTTENSLHGTTADDFVTNNGITALVDGNYTVSSGAWDGGVANAGAVTFGDGLAGTTGPVTTSNSVIGTPPGGISGTGARYTSGDTLVVATFQNRLLVMKVDRSTITAPASPAAFSSSSPQRFVDTRATGETLDDMFEAEGKRAAGAEYRVQIAGRGSVPVGAKAVAMNVTAIAAEGVGFVTVHPCLDPAPNASSLNHSAGVNLGNEIIAPLSDAGLVCFFTSGSVHLTVDVTATIPADSPLTPVSPARFLDNRAGGVTIDGQSQGGPRPAAGSVITLQIAGRGDVPAEARAAIINLTAINPGQRGFLTAYPCNLPAPDTASLNYETGVNRGNEIYASLDDDGRACIRVSSPVNVTGDVVAYFTKPPVIRVGPVRLLDTRATGVTFDGLHQGEGKRAADGQLVVQVGGRPGIPGTVKTVIVNVTAINADGTGFVTVHPCQPTRPNTASLNFVRGVNGGNEIVAEVADGKICLYTSAQVHLTADIVAAE